jgi:hypothetical protein
MHAHMRKPEDAARSKELPSSLPAIAGVRQPSRQIGATGRGLFDHAGPAFSLSPWRPAIRIGATDDLLERQADAAAELVVAGHRVPPIASVTSPGSVAGEVLHRKVGDAASDVSGAARAIAARTVASPGLGEPLHPETRSALAAGFGRDVGHVRVHSDGAARAAASALNTVAFAHRHHIWLGHRASQTDLGLMAHETAHVFQQGAVLRRGPKPAAAAAAAAAKADKAKKRKQATQLQHTLKKPLPQPLAKRQAEAQNRQVLQIKTLYVNEQFDQNGVPQRPASASPIRQQASDVELVTQFTGLNTSPRSARPRRTVPVQFVSEYCNYTIDLVNRSGSLTSHPFGVDITAPFTVRKVTVKDSGGHTGRVSHKEERWAHNLAYWSQFNLATANTIAQHRHGLDLGRQWVPAHVTFTAIPTDPSQPYIFYVANAGGDPNFRYHDRKFRPPADFDTAYQQVPSGQRREVAQVSKPHRIPRKESGRTPSAAMGNTQAHEHMVGAQHPFTPFQGTQGVHLASHEWCHLIGDGDGGPILPGNLVIGTNAVNTEQLAMETGLRLYRTQLKHWHCSVVLRVKAITTPSPVALQGQQTTALQATWISYEISVVNSDDRNDGNRIAVHRQIMDASRGTITAGEFTYLEQEVRHKLRSVIAQISQLPRMASGKYAVAQFTSINP